MTMGNMTMGKGTAFVRGMLLAALVVATTVSTSSAQAVSNWFDGRGPTRVVYYRPVAAASYAAPYSVGYRGVPYRVGYRTVAPAPIAQAVPRTTYRTRWGRIPVTTYHPVVTQDPYTGAHVTQMVPCTTTRWQAYRVPVTTYRWGWANWRNWRLFQPRHPVYVAPPMYAATSPCAVPTANDGWRPTGTSTASEWQQIDNQNTGPGTGDPSLAPSDIPGIPPEDPATREPADGGTANGAEQAPVSSNTLNKTRSVLPSSGPRYLRPIPDPDRESPYGPALKSGRARTAMVPLFQSAPIARASYTVAQPRHELQKPHKKTKWSNSDWRAK